MDAEQLDLVLDVGNTRTKWALFGTRDALSHGSMVDPSATALAAVLGGLEPRAIAIGSTSRHDPHFLAEMERIAPVAVFTGRSASPLSSAYTTPGTLGADRLANAVAAKARFPDRPVLVIDAGTCITYDVCGSDDAYAGGAITPGLHMRNSAMHAYSARLPMVDVSDDPRLIGVTTNESLASGIHFGILGEMEGYIRRLGTERPGMAVLLTGGDALRFVRGLESGIFALPLLTLEGYHALLTHHRSLHGNALAPDAGAADGSGTTG